MIFGRENGTAGENGNNQDIMRIVHSVMNGAGFGFF